MLAAPATAEVIITYLAALRSGRPVAPVDPRLVRSRAGELVTRFAPAALLGAPGAPPPGYRAEGRAWVRTDPGAPVHPDLAVVLLDGPGGMRLSRRAVRAEGEGWRGRCASARAKATLTSPPPVHRRGPGAAQRPSRRRRGRRRDRGLGGERGVLGRRRTLGVRLVRRLAARVRAARPARLGRRPAPLAAQPHHDRRRAAGGLLLLLYGSRRHPTRPGPPRFRGPGAARRAVVHRGRRGRLRGRHRRHGLRPLGGATWPGATTCAACCAPGSGAASTPTATSTSPATTTTATCSTPWSWIRAPDRTARAGRRSPPPASPQTGSQARAARTSGQQPHQVDPRADVELGEDVAQMVFHRPGLR